MKKIIPLLVLTLASCSTIKSKNIIVKKIEEPQIVKAKNEIPKINHLTKKIQLINSLVAGQSYDDAIKEINLLIQEYPQNYVFYDMEGSVQFIKGNHELAKESFEKSIRLNPKNKEAKLMLEKSKKQAL